MGRGVAFNRIVIFLLPSALSMVDSSLLPCSTIRYNFGLKMFGGLIHLPS